MPEIGRILLFFKKMSKFFGKIVQFFRDVRAEMGKVVWPTRKDIIRYTVTVIVFSIVMAAILGGADFGLLKGFEAIIK